MNNIMHELRPLTDDERLNAVQSARDYIIKSYGDKPRRQQFLDVTVSQYPAWFTRLVAAFMLVVFIAAAMPSLFRLYSAGYTYFLHGIDNQLLASIVGVSTFLLAEFLIILSTISARLYFDGRSRYIFVIPITLGLAMALVGNWVIAQPYDLFGWLETLAPPVAVLFLALIGERIVLDEIRSRHANERAYQEALKEWQQTAADPEQSPRWRAAYANALKSAIYDANRSGAGSTARKELMNGLRSGEWRALVVREMRADSWFDDQPDAAPVAVKTVVTPANPTLARPEPIQIHQNGNGNGARAILNDQ